MSNPTKCACGCGKSIKLRKSGSGRQKLYADDTHKNMIAAAHAAGVEFKVIPGRIYCGFCGKEVPKRAKGSGRQKLHCSKSHKAMAYRLRHPDKDAAHQAVAYARKCGLLKPQPCEVCSNPKTEAHHKNYSAKLSVNWLCRKHHEKAHIK